MRSRISLCERDDEASREREETVGALGGVVAFEGESHLDDAEAEQDEPDRADEREDESGQVIHRRERIPRRPCELRHEDRRRDGRQGDAAHHDLPQKAALKLFVFLHKRGSFLILSCYGFGLELERLLDLAFGEDHDVALLLVESPTRTHAHRLRARCLRRRRARPHG